MINSKNFKEVKKQLQSSYGMDVTGGMLHKVEESLKLAKTGVKTHIIDGNDKNELKNILLKPSTKGTHIK